MSAKDILTLVASIVVCQLVGLVSGLATASSVDTWYATLVKPAFNPPNWLFSPVWITLYGLMGIALFLVYRKGLDTKGVRAAIAFFVVQLIANSFWSVLFFGLQLPFIAFLEIMVLWVLILLTMIKFLKISRPAGLLLLPYFLWVSFAAILNFFLWSLNRS
jgi:tryptophan-rich sensory protein